MKSKISMDIALLVYDQLKRYTLVEYSPTLEEDIRHITNELERLKNDIRRWTIYAVLSSVLAIVYFFIIFI